MQILTSSAADLRTVTDIMRELSRLTDPDDAAELYGNGIRKLNLAPNDRYVGVSRRDLESPQYRITRCSSWKVHPNPWLEREKLPHFTGGLLAEILYGNEAVILRDLRERLRPDDPAYEYLSDMRLLISLPHFDNGQSINAGILLAKTADNYPLDAVPMMVWMANLWGRATLNLVNKQKLDAAYRAIDGELQVVGDIQRSLLPRELPRIEGIEIGAHYQTSQRAGGDYYDFFPLPEGKWGIFVADVSGHGTPAAVMMAITHAIAHSHPGHPTPPAAMLAYLNEKLACRYTTDNGTFITALYGILDPAERTLRFGSAGHPLPRIVRGGGPVDYVADTSLPLGISPNEKYVEQTVALARGDRVVLYTDGIVESFNPLGEQFGAVRLDGAIARSNGEAGATIRDILTRLDEFTAGGALTDDRTLLALILR